MKFKAAKTKVVRIGKGKYATFKDGTFSTDVKSEIELLLKAKNVKSEGDAIEPSEQFSIDYASEIKGKKELDEYAEKFGFNLDGRKSIDGMLTQLKELCK